jgi:hypothetical protein
VVFEGGSECEASQTYRNNCGEVLTPWRIFKQGKPVPALPGSKDIFMGPALLVRNKAPSQLLLVTLKLLFSL